MARRKKNGSCGVAVLECFVILAIVGLITEYWMHIVAIGILISVAVIICKIIDLWKSKNTIESVPNVNIQSNYNNYNQKQIDFMDGHNFEYFCADILKNNGYKDVEVTRGSGDHGVDIIAVRDGIRYAVQCKRFTGNVGNKAVQEIYFGKSYYHCHVGIVMTNSYFTPAAKEAAKESGVILWDRDFLMRYINSTETIKDNTYKAPEKETNENISEYDVKKGAYPSGYYVTGRTISLGGYILKPKSSNDRGCVTIYRTYENLLNEEDEVFYHYFNENYFLTISQNDLHLLVEGADMQRVYEIN